MAITQEITLPSGYSGVIPDKATQNEQEFANAVHPFMNSMNADFVPQMQTMGEELNELAVQINTESVSMNQIESNTETIVDDGIEDMDRIKDETIIIRNETESIKDEAVEAKNIALSASNYKGVWDSEYVGGYALGDTVAYGEDRFLSNSDGNTDEPSLNWENITNLSLAQVIDGGNAFTIDALILDGGGA